MNTTEELLSIKHRIGGVEYELEQLKRRVGVLELEISPPPPVAVIPPRATAVEPLATPPPLPATFPVEAETPPTMQYPTFAKESEPAPAPEPQPAFPFREMAARPLPVPPPVYVREKSFMESARPLLERLQLWPPSGSGNKEVQLGAWWATRLGILFAVIGAVFFGVYISLNTPPWIKLLELTALAVGTTGLGAWLERRMPKFGQVLSAGGLAMIFFTAMAAYTVPAVKVIDNRLIASFWQIGVTAGIGFVAWRKNSQPVATMAVVLGYVAVWFSFSGGLQLFALASSLGLAATAVTWKRWLKWDAPSLVALAGYWLTYGLLLSGIGARGGLPLPEWVWGFVTAGFAVFFWRDDHFGRLSYEKSPEQEVWVQNVNSTAALVLGWLTAWIAFPASLGTFYATAAVVLGAASWRRMTTAVNDPTGAVLLAKALGALMLAVIKWTDPDTTALALIVQAGVMIVTNRRLRSAVIAAGSGVVATVALAYWLMDVGPHPMDVLTLRTCLRAVTFAGFVAWGMETARDCGCALNDESRKQIAQVVSAIGALLALLLAQAVLPTGWMPVWCIAGALILAAAGAAWKRTEPWAAAALVVLGGHIALWSRLSHQTTLLTENWLNTLSVLVPTLVGAWWLGRAAEVAWRRTAAWWASALGVVSLAGCVAATHGADAVLLTGLGLAIALSIAAPWQARRNWLWLATWSLGVGVVGYVARSWSQHSAMTDEAVRWIVAAVALIGPALLAAWPRGRAQLEAESPKGWTQALTIAVGVLFALVVSMEGYSHGSDTAMERLAGFALLTAGLFTWAGMRAYRTASWVITAVTAGSLLLAYRHFDHVDKWIVVVATWLPALLWTKLPWVQERWRAMGTRVTFSITGQTWLAGAVTALAIGLNPSASSVAWFAAVALLAVAGSRVGFVAMVEVALGWIVLGLGQAVLLIAERGETVAVLETGFIAVVAVAVVSLVVARWLPAGKLLGQALRPVQAWVLPVAGLAVIFMAMYAQHGEMQPYVTVGWGIAALTWFGFGLFARARPDRLIGLAGLALCIPRMFVVDLHSTFHRIAAFGVLGVVLLWVGFSYHKFRNLIVDDNSSPSDETDKKL